MKPVKPRSQSNGDGAKKKVLDGLKAKANGAQARARQRGEELLALIERRKGRIVEDFYDIGEALREIQRKELFRPLGYRTFDELLTARDVMSPFQARKLIAVVERVPRAQALALGQEKAYALVAYAAATPEPDTPTGLLESGAKVGGKAIAEASTRDLLRAASEVRAKVRAKAPKTPEQRATARALQEAVRKLRAHLRALGVGRPAIAESGGALRVTLTVAQVQKMPEP